MPMLAENNKRIMKNTLLLYIRMGITMLVSLYTSRIVLKALGVDDFGIYSIVCSVIVAFSFISSPLSSATQRFYNFELGRNNKERLNIVFNHSVLIYVFFAIFIFLIIEIGVLWFISQKMQLPVERLSSAKYAFHFCALAFVLRLLKIPFESLIIAHEKMSFYAYVCILEVLLNLFNAYSLSVFLFDKLELYTINNFVISLINIISVFVYCHRQFPYIHFQRIWDKDIFRSLLSFSGWNLFGSVASMTANQGLNILLNLFYGVAVNAAMGIANQVNGAVNQFVSNFQVAFRPQLVKNYASGSLDSLRILIISTSKYSFILLFGIVCPFIFNMHFILELWLGDVPFYTAEFCTLILVYTLLETLSAPMWMTVQATGCIRTYQLVMSSVIFLNILFSYYFLHLGFTPLVVLVIKCCLDFVYLAVRLLFIRRMIQFPIGFYIKNVVLRLIIIVFLSIVSIYAFTLLMLSGWFKLVFSCISFILVYIPIVYYIGLNTNERNMLMTMFRSKF